MNDDILALPQDADPLLRRAAIFLATGDFASADAYCEKVLDKTPENAFAYLIKAMAKLKLQNSAALVDVSGLPDLPEFKLARQFADPGLAAKLDELAEKNAHSAVVEQKMLAEAEAKAAARRQAQAESEAALAATARAECTMRVETLEELLSRDLPEELAAETRTRIAAEQALMQSASPEAAEREADATSALKDKIVPALREKLAALLPKLEKIAQDQNLPKSNREIVSKRGDKILSLLEDPDADLRTLGYESARCQTEFDTVCREIKSRDRGLWIAVGFLILLAILAFISITYKA